MQRQDTNTAVNRSNKGYGVVESRDILMQDRCRLEELYGFSPQSANKSVAVNAFGQHMPGEELDSLQSP